MADEVSETEAATYPRGFSRDIDWKWPMVPARKLVALNYGRALKADTRSPGKVPVFGTNGQCGWHDAPLAKAPGLILGRKGQGPLGVEWCDKDFWVIDTAYYASTLTPDIDLKYLYHLVKYVGLNHLKDGTSNPTLSRDTFGAQLFPLPPLAEQKAIAAVLGALDDKIELNRRMNATLEAMARSLFQSWFVDFDPVRKNKDEGGRIKDEISALFPDSFQESEAGHIPQGWKIKTLSDLTSLITKGTTPTQDDMNEAPDIDAQFNYIRVNSIDEEGSVLADKLTTIPESIHIGVLKRSILKANDILYTIAGTIGRVAMVEDWLLPANTNQAVAIIRPEPEIPSGFLMLTMRQEAFRKELHNNIVHAVQANLSLGMLSKARLVVPPSSVLPQLFKPIDAILSQISANRAQSRTLATLRDTLLPKLLSGELSVAPMSVTNT